MTNTSGTWVTPYAERMRIEDTYPLSSGLTLEQHYCSTCDESRQWLTELHVLKEVDRHGEVVRETTLPMVRAWATPRELANLFGWCGFESERLYGAFDGAPLAKDSTEMIWVLRRA